MKREVKYNLDVLRLNFVKGIKILIPLFYIFIISYFVTKVKFYFKTYLTYAKQMGRMARSKRIQHSRPYLLNNFLSVQVHKHKLLTNTIVHRLLNQYSFYYLTFFTLVNTEGLVIKRTTLLPQSGLMTSPLDNIMILLLGMIVKCNLDVIRLNYNFFKKET